MFCVNITMFKLILLVGLFCVGEITCKIKPVAENLRIDQLPVDEIEDINIIIHTIVNATVDYNVTHHNYYVRDRAVLCHDTWIEIIESFDQRVSGFGAILQNDIKPLLETYADNEIVLNKLNEVIDRLTNDTRSTGLAIEGGLYHASNRSIGFGVYMFNYIERIYREVKSNLDFKKGTCLADFEGFYWDAVVEVNACVKHMVMDAQKLYFDWAYFLADIRKSRSEWMHIDYLSQFSNEEILSDFENFLKTMQEYLRAFEKTGTDEAARILQDVYKCLAKSYISNTSKSAFCKSRLDCLKS